MRASTVAALAGGLALALTACSDPEMPSGPGQDPADRPPELSVVTFSMTTLGNPTDNSAASAINELGQVLVTLGPEPYRPWIWTNGSFVKLLHPFDADQVQGFDINANAVAVGDVDHQAAAWVNGELTMLRVPAGVTGSQALAINDAGQIVGTAFLPGNINTSPVIWQNKDQEMTELPGGVGRAVDINNAGEIVGSSLDEGANFIRGAYWASSSAQPQFVKGPNGQPCGDPYSINDRSEMAGFCGDEAAYWSAPGANAVTLDDGTSTASRINELGQIVGVRRINGSFDFHATLWQQEGSAYRAFDLGIPAEYSEGRVEDVNNHGQAVGGAHIDFSNLGLLWQIPVRVVMDVVPGAVSSIKLGGTGNVAAALLGSQWFHAGDIDPSSLTLGNDNGTETPVARKKNAPVAKLTDVNRDGNLDLVVEFPKQMMTKAGDLVAGSQVLVVQGRLRDGTRLRGADQVTGVR